MALPVDPGEHQIVVKAPGKKPWSRYVVVAADADRQEVEVAPLEDEPAAPSAPAPVESSKPASQPGSGLRNAAWVVGGAGVVLVGVASYFGIRAITDHASAKDRCPGSTCADLEGVRMNESSQNEAEVSTAGFALGGAALGVAAFLFLTSSSPSAPTPSHALPRARLRCEPRFLAHGAGAVLSADW
jgi:serine/threonine-protein kinase